MIATRVRQPDNENGMRKMVLVKKIVLDVLKPHRPNSLEFATSLAERCADCCVNVNVDAVDENTESLIVVIEGSDLRYDEIAATITEMGGSIHSIDEVQVASPAKPSRPKQR
jgi:hypothetical protein